MYADNDNIFKQLENIWTYQYGVNNLDAQDISLPHVKLQKDNKNIVAQVLKDGQTASARFELQCQTTAYIAYGSISTHFLQAYVNLTPTMVKDLQNYFAHHSSSEDIRYFYIALDSNYVPTNNRISNNIGSFGGGGDSAGTKLNEESDTSRSGIARFESFLYSQIMQSKGYLSVWFWWEWQVTYWKTQYTTISEACW